MTDKEIIKVLECCRNGDGSCEDCPSNNKRKGGKDCIDEVIREALALIHRQQAEIETAKQKAVREFAEKLNAKFENYAREDWYGTKYFLVGEGVVNRIANEMFGNPEQVKGE